MKLENPAFMTSANWGKVHIEKNKGDNTYKATSSHDGATVTFNTTLQDDGSLRVAPTGSLEIYISGDRDPEWRARAERRFGVYCDLATAFAKKLYCPHTKRAIPVSRIVDNPVLWIDREHGVAIKCGNHTYETPDAPPVPSAGKYDRPIKYSFSNPKAAKALMERMRPIWEEAKLRLELSQHEGIGYKSQSVLTFLAKNPDIHDFVTLSQATLKDRTVSDELIHMYHVAWGMRIVNPWAEEYWRDAVSAECADRYESTYLEFR